MPNDLTTKLVKHIYTTLTGTKQTVDVTTLFVKDKPTAIASKPTEVDDVNTLYQTYLP